MNFIRVHKNSDGTGDNLTRDANMIFPPNVTSFYKQVRVKESTYLDKRTGTMQQKQAYTYSSSRKRPNHPEELRWRWWFRELQESYRPYVGTPTDKQVWVNRICKWYFIKEEDLRDWTYQEWAWAYVNAVRGHPNRGPDNEIILSYDAFLRGDYTIPNFDIDGNIIWPK
jgi:hypothetical protein